MSMTAVATSVSAPGWLRSVRFDGIFILGLAGLGLAAATAALVQPALFWPILFADLWLLGYHHVIATYTRLCFDAESFRTHRFLLFGLPPLVLAAVLGAAYGIGIWTLVSVYLYWQWFHYARQSWGVAQAYRRKAGDLDTGSPQLNQIAFWLLPAWGILYRSQQDPGLFLGLELRTVPVPAMLVDAAGVAAAIALILWAADRARAFAQGRLPVAHTLYLLTHHAVFAAAYLLIEDISVGWLAVNVWHNAQYVAFVWLFNTNRFRTGIDPRARFLSMLAQSRNALLYFAVCVALSTLVYLLLGWVAAAVVAPIAIYQAINFHHYIVDSVIWKLRRPPLQRTLGLAA